MYFMLIKKFPLPHPCGLFIYYHFIPPPRPLKNFTEVKLICNVVLNLEGFKN